MERGSAPGAPIPAEPVPSGEERAVSEIRAILSTQIRWSTTRRAACDRPSQRALALGPLVLELHGSGKNFFPKAPGRLAASELGRRSGRGRLPIARGSLEVF